MSAIDTYTALLLKLDDWYETTPAGVPELDAYYFQLARYLLARIRRARLVTAPAYTYTPHVECKSVFGYTDWGRFAVCDTLPAAIESAERLMTKYPGYAIAWRIQRNDGVVVAVSEQVSGLQEAA